MPNPNDGTQLGTGEVISDETIGAVLPPGALLGAGAPAQMVGTTDAQKRDPMLPGGQYKVPRSKIAIGPYGQDWGDVSEYVPLQVTDAIQRRFHELDRLTEIDENRINLIDQGYTGQRFSLSDRRGHHLSTRGVR